MAKRLNYAGLSMGIGLPVIDESGYICPKIIPSKNIQNSSSPSVKI